VSGRSVDITDEIDAYPGDVGGEGDPILLAERRSATFRLRRKIFMVSTPTVKGISRVQREFEKSDQRYFFVPCTKCGHYQHLRFTQLRWPEGKPEEAKYACESCGHLMHNHEKTSLLSKGEWRATAESVDGTVGYHLSSLYSPVGWFKLDSIGYITDFVQITDDGTDSTLYIDQDGGADNFVAVATILGVTGLTDEVALETSGALVTV